MASLVIKPVDVDDAGDASIRLEKKHPLAIRWMHWINFPVFFTMVWSGLLIYWNDSDNAYQHPHAVYRIGQGKALHPHIRGVASWLDSRLQLDRNRDFQGSCCSMFRQLRRHSLVVPTMRSLDPIRLTFRNTPHLL
jgi:hypothetical protein